MTVYIWNDNKGIPILGFYWNISISWQSKSKIYRIAQVLLTDHINILLQLVDFSHICIFFLFWFLTSTHNTNLSSDILGTDSLIMAIMSPTWAYLWLPYPIIQSNTHQFSTLLLSAASKMFEIESYYFIEMCHFNGKDEEEKK